MDATPSFTGRPRRRTTRPWVRTGDRVARVVITAGGIGTIVAVLLVGVFLLAVALPLFRSATVRREAAASFGDTGSTPAWLGVDESGAVAWIVEPDGRVRVVGVVDGAALAEIAAADTGLAGATVVRVVPGTLHAVAGFADGSVRSGRLGLETSFCDEAGLPAGTRPPDRGQAVASAAGILVRDAHGRLARVVPVVDLAPPTRSLDAAIVDVDVAPLAGGPLVAALDARGRIRVESVTSKRNLLTDEVVVQATGATIEPEPDCTPRFVRVSELGDQVFAVAADGRGRRNVIRDVAAPVAMEAFAVTPTGDRVVAVERLFGGMSLAVADARGIVRTFFATRGAEGEAANGLANTAAH
ncbi:MAG: hypothetical protein ACKOZU_04580, partial [Planctomycetaceae bacterium]